MTRPTRVAVAANGSRVRVDLGAGTIVPRLIARDSDSARIALVAGGALLLGGDRVDIEIDVGDGCALALEDVGGTVAYDADGVRSFWTVDIRVGRGARLTWLGLPLVVAGGADVRRTTRIRLAEGATALLRESLVLGRSGERGGRVVTRTSATDPDGPLLEESIDVDGARGVPGILGSHRVLDTVVCLGTRPREVDAGDAVVLRLEGPGSIARYLGAEAHRSPVPALWASWEGVSRDRMDVGAT